MIYFTPGGKHTQGWFSLVRNCEKTALSCKKNCVLACGNDSFTFISYCRNIWSVSVQVLEWWNYKYSIFSILRLMQTLKVVRAWKVFKIIQWFFFFSFFSVDFSWICFQGFCLGKHKQNEMSCNRNELLMESSIFAVHKGCILLQSVCSK